MSVALSADGSTAIVGGWSDNSKTGAAWVFTRNGGVWTQQGKKLVGTDAVGSARQGMSVALSADGNTAILGGPGTTRGIDRRPLASARPVQHGCLPAVAVSGHSKTNWSAPVPWRA